jgi:DNA-binding PadR family transcriptional regulator
MILDLINEGPLHGYEIMKHFQDEFNGLYQPSSGSTYPILQAFDEQGYVNVEKSSSKQRKANFKNELNAWKRSLVREKGCIKKCVI